MGVGGKVTVGIGIDGSKGSRVGSSERSTNVGSHSLSFRTGWFRSRRGSVSGKYRTNEKSGRVKRRFPFGPFVNKDGGDVGGCKSRFDHDPWLTHIYFRNVRVYTLKRRCRSLVLFLDLRE